MISAALDDAARKLSFVQASLPRRETRRVRRESRKVTVDGVGDRLVKDGIEHRAQQVFVARHLTSNH